MNLSFGMSTGLGAILLAFFAHAQPACAGKPTGKFTSYPVAYSAPYGIVYDEAGPLKGIWFTNATLDAKSGAVEFSSKGPKTTLHATPTAAALPGSINFVPGSDSLWFPRRTPIRLHELTGRERLLNTRIPTAGSKPLDIQHGPGDTMWFTESAAGKIGRIDSTGKITEYKVGAANDEPTALIAQAGALWFTEVGSGRIGRLTTSGDVSHFSTGKGKLTGDMTNGSDGSLWAPKSKSVVRVKTDGTLTEFPLPAGVVKTGAIFGKKGRHLSRSDQIRRARSNSLNQRHGTGARI